MIRQFYPQRARAQRFHGRPIGTIPAGSILYIQHSGYGQPPVRVNPWIVEAWIPRTIGAAARVNGRYVDRRAAGGHLAIVRSLRNGRRTTVADHFLVWADDAGLVKH